MASRRKLTRWQRVLGLVRRLNHMTAAITVGGVGFYASYQHIYRVSVRYGQPQDIAALMPIAIDALMIVAGRYVTHAKSRLGKAYAVAGFIMASMASLAANIMAAPADTVSRVIAGWPAVCLVLAALIVHYGERKPRPKRKPRQSQSASQAPQVIPAARRRVPPTPQRPSTLRDLQVPWDGPTQSQNRVAPLPR